MAMQYGFIIDSERCVDCRACVTACLSSNNVEIGVMWRHVKTTWKGQYPAVSFRSRSMSCNHCADPACIKACPVKAITKRSEDGIVVVDRTKCIGCHLCEDACPFGAPRYGKDGLMQKCDLCLERVTAGEKPACVTTCSAGALTFGTMDELPKLAGKRKVVRLEGPTGPSVFVTVSAT